MLDSEGIYIGASSALNVVAAEELALQLGPGTHRRLFFGHIRDHSCVHRENYRHYAL